MQSIMRFSMFGNYEKFNTSNAELYIKLIEFFRKNNYGAATANELQIQQNGQSRVLFMPLFLNNTNNTMVEIMSGRINFQISYENNTKEIGLVELNERFSNELENFIDKFIKDMNLSANRVALNCEIVKNSNRNDCIFQNTQSIFFDKKERIEILSRDAVQKEINNEMSNIILEKTFNFQNNLIKYSYDINSIAENTTFRFDSSSNILEMYKSYVTVAKEIEEGLK